MQVELSQAEQQVEQQAKRQAERLYFSDGEVEMRYESEIEPISLESILENLRGEGLRIVECLIMARAADSFDKEFTAQQWMEKVRELLVELGICHELDAGQRANEMFEKHLEEVSLYLEEVSS